MNLFKKTLKWVREDFFLLKEMKVINQQIYKIEEDIAEIRENNTREFKEINAINKREFKVVKADITKLLKIIKNNRANFQPTINSQMLLKKKYEHIPRADFGLQVLIENFDFESVLDIGSGEGVHSQMFYNAGKKVTAIDYGKSSYFEKNQFDKFIIGNFNDYEFENSFDCIWASHVLEHQLNPHTFLKNVFKILKEDGVVAITVPPMKHEIVGGHVSLWNAGLLLYNLVLAGFDCKDAFVCSYGYNITVILKKKSINQLDLVYDNGDITKISKYLPTEVAHEPFDGNIEIIIPKFLVGKIMQ
ncbi:MAG: methyltransferase domain-containing protein [Bacteroidales bacterium]|nr:methyltransferase domain-containing protein [Bacteroidales bacterium]